MIKESDQVILKKGKSLKVFQIKKNRPIWMEKARFVLNGVIGYPYGTIFEVKNEQLVKVSRQDLDADVDTDCKQGADNRNLTDSQANQKLTKEDIQSLRADGVTGQDLVEQIIENSATFKEKTEFAQQKYIKKKKKKHLPVFTILRPTTRLLAEMYFNKGPLKICHLRMDSLAQILTQSNVRAHTKMMVVESCVGLVLGAVMERMSGLGTVVQLYGGTAPARQALEAYNFPKEYYNNLHSFPLNLVNTIKSTSISGKESEQKSLEIPQKEKESQESLNTAVPCPTSDDRDLMEAETNQTSTSQCNIQNNTQCPSPSKQATQEGEQSNQEDSETSTTHKAGEKRKPPTEEEKQRRREWRIKQIQQTREIVQKADMDGLIVASKYHPTPIVLKLIEFVAPSRQIVVYSQNKEPLVDCYTQLRDRGGIVNLKLSETWLREYQVLPGRTHPVINMSGASGYLLTGTTITMD